VTSLLRYFHTLRYVKLGQIYWRIYYKFYTPCVDLSLTPAIRKKCERWNVPAKGTARMIEDMEFKFLNEIHSLHDASDWNNSYYSKLWLYNLHYFNDLNAIGAESRINWHRNLIAKWIEQNQPGTGNGWEAYPLSLRIVNWIKWTKAGNSFEETWNRSLAIQVRFLLQSIEWHLLGNHLFANAKALIFAGIYFEGEEAEHWYATGMNILIRELPEQILPDGGNFELSTMYHSIFLEDLLDLINLFQCHSIPIPEGLSETVIRMINWLKVMIHPDQEISFFNDAAFDIAITPEELFSYAMRLGLNSDLRKSKITHLTDSGYLRVEEDVLVLILDVADIGPDYLPGHAHADTLSFELSLFNERVFVNSGTSVYGLGATRLKERGTASHNSLVIDDLNSSEVWSGFRVARRARAFDVNVYNNGGCSVVKGSHTGYKRLNGKPVHTRAWEVRSNSLKIIDLVSGKNIHSIASLFHLHPNVDIRKVNVNKYFLSNINKNNFMIEFNGYDEVELLPYEYHSEFGKTELSKMFSCKAKRNLPVEAEVMLSWSV